MAQSAVIGALRVVLGMDTAQWEQGATKTQLSLGKMAKAGALAGAAIAGALTAMAGAVGYAVLKTINHIDDLNDVSQRIGVPVEQLSALAHAASLSGTDLDGLATAMRRFSVNMNEAADGTGKGAGAFAALGISVKDSEGNLRKHTDVMADIAERFAGMEDGAGKTALAMTLFGRSGTDLIPMLNEGRDGLKAMTDEAAELGLVIDTKVAKAADAFNDNLTRLKAVKQGLVTLIAARMLPVLLSFTNMLVNAMKNTKLMDQAARVLAGTFRVLVTAGIAVGGAFAYLGTIISGVAGALVAANRGEFSEALKRLDTAGAKATDVAKGTGKAISDIWAKAAAATPASKAVSDKIAAPIFEAGEKAKAGAKKVKEGVDEAAREMERLKESAIRVIQGLETPYERTMRDFAEDTDVLRRAHEKGLITADAYADALERAANRREGANLKLQEPFKVGEGFISTEDSMKALDAAITGSAKTAREKFADSFGFAFADGIEAAARGDLKGFLLDFFSQIGRSALASLGNLIGRGLFDSLGGMSGGGGGGGILGLLGKVFGGGRGFNSGGSFTIGGMGGVDRNIVMFPGSRGEKVDIHKKGADAGPVQQVFYVNAQGSVLAGDLMSEMQRVGVQAAFAGGSMGQRNTERSLQRRQVRRLGVG